MTTTQVVSREQVAQMREANLADINSLKAQIYQMDVQAAATVSQTKALKNASLQGKRKMRNLLLRAQKMDRLLRDGHANINGQTLVVQ